MGKRLLGRILRRLEEVGRYGPRLPSEAWNGLRGSVTPILYHRIAEHSDNAWLERCGMPVTPPTVFKRQLRWLRQEGASFYTFEDLRRGRFPTSSEVGVIVTFDDGFFDALNTGSEILEEEGIRAVFFVTSRMVLPAPLLWEHRLFRLMADPLGRRALQRSLHTRLGAFGEDEVVWALKSVASPTICDEVLSFAEAESSVPPVDTGALYPTSELLREVRSRGHEIGAHGASHRMRHTLSAEEFRVELVHSKAALEEILGESISSFSYPFNDWLLGDEAICAAAGYETVATVNGGRLARRDELMPVPRRTVHRLHDRRSAFRRLVLEETGPVGPAPGRRR